MDGIVLESHQLKNGHIEALHTLLHEMAHQYNAEKEISDCADNGRHNKKFVHAAAKFSLATNQVAHKTLGFAITEVTGYTLEVIEEFGPNLEVYEMYSKFNAKEKKDKKKSELKSVTVDAETKETILEASKELGCDQKELVKKAIAFYLDCLQKGTVPEEYKVVTNDNEE